MPETGAYWGYGKEENMQSSESYQMSWKFPYSQETKRGTYKMVCIFLHVIMWLGDLGCKPNNRTRKKTQCLHLLNSTET